MSCVCEPILHPPYTQIIPTSPFIHPKNTYFTLHTPKEYLFHPSYTQRIPTSPFIVIHPKNTYFTLHTPK